MTLYEELNLGQKRLFNTVDAKLNEYNFKPLSMLEVLEALVEKYERLVK